GATLARPEDNRRGNERRLPSADSATSRRSAMRASAQPPGPLSQEPPFAAHERPDQPFHGPGVALALAKASKNICQNGGNRMPARRGTGSFSTRGPQRPRNPE